MNLRQATESDKPKIAELIENDPYHKGVLDTEFFYAGDLWVLSDDAGPILYIRKAKAMRIHVQFVDDKLRTAKALMSVLPAFAKFAKDNGYREMIFESQSPLLSKFCTKNMGFVASPNEFILGLS